MNRTPIWFVDIGGDDRGAYALGRFAGGILQEGNYEMLLVLNHYRPLTSTPEEAIQIMQEIEQACGLPFTGLINNSNLGEETTPQDVLKNRPLHGRGLPPDRTSRPLYHSQRIHLSSAAGTD